MLALLLGVPMNSIPTSFVIPHLVGHERFFLREFRLIMANWGEGLIVRFHCQIGL
jgi:hypothetical protein